jgi:alpha/beta superfamily hydrolase
MITTFTALKPAEKTEMIQGPAGQLELIVSKEESETHKPWAIICHPHPLFGGTMHNKVVTTLAKAFQSVGANTVRFNFRGVMRSEGEFDHGKGELADLLAVIDWVTQQSPTQPIWLGGFSFGACIAAIAATQIDAKKLVTIAPAVQHVEMQTLPPITCQWVLVQGDRDDVVSPQAVFDWVDSRDPKPILLRFPDAGHFFHGLLQELRVRIEEVLR